MVDTQDALIGQRLGDKYRVIRQIGRGGMGVVYEAEHVELGKRVAIKLMLEKYAADSDAITRFKREALAASRIGNPHIIDISDIGTAADGRLYVVMELLHGQPLADAIKRDGPLELPRAMKIMRQTLRAVGAAHGKQIIHRDLKPDNIFLVGEEDHVKLLDFGISKVIAGSAETAATALTSTGAVIGTPLYMAPEQAMGEPTDARADIYALGVILYEMLTGRPPFIGPTFAALVMKVLTTDAELVSTLRPDVPGNVVAAVHRALEKEPARRFESCDAFAAALSGRTGTASVSPALVGGPGSVSDAGGDARRLASGLDQTAPSGEVPAAVTASARRSKTPVLVGVVGSVLVAAVGAFLILDRGSSSPPPRSAAPPAIAPAGMPTQLSPVAEADALVVADPVPQPMDPVLPDAVPPPVPVTRPPTTLPTPAPTPALPAPAPAAPLKPATLKDVTAAIDHHDGKRCRAALARLSDPPPTSERYRSLHAICEMIAGNCAGGTAEQRVIDAKHHMGPESTAVTANLYCPPDSDPALKLKRLGMQISTRTHFDCTYYYKLTHTAGASASSEQDRRTIGSLLASIAKCYSTTDPPDCARARTVLAEAQTYIPALDEYELGMGCRD